MNRVGVEIDSTSLDSTSMDYRLRKVVLLEDWYLREESMEFTASGCPDSCSFLGNKLF
jgi:hypothetical protein